VKKLYGGLEGGGTKFVCLVGSGPDDILAETQFPTTTPETTIQQVIDFFRQKQDEYGEISAIGVAPFGPLDLNPVSKKYGYITSTPKPGWANTNILGIIQQALSLPLGFDTDVNAAALGEWYWGAAKGLDTFIYVTIGTGIGGGGMVNNRLMHGLLHPEMGHIYVPRIQGTDQFPSICPFHSECLEGLASGPAIEKRWGKPAEKLPVEHPAWKLEAHYLSLGIVNWIYTLSPQKVILGGGVMKQEHLLPLIRDKVYVLLNEYPTLPEIQGNMDEYIVPPLLGTKAGVLGALALAMELVNNRCV